MIEYIVYGVKELLSKPDLTPDEMAKHKIEVRLLSRKDKDFTRFLEVEIQIEFILRNMGYVPGEEKEIKRIELLKDAGYEQMVEFWQEAMRERI